MTDYELMEDLRVRIDALSKRVDYVEYRSKSNRVLLDVYKDVLSEVVDNFNDRITKFEEYYPSGEPHVCAEFKTAKEIFKMKAENTTIPIKVEFGEPVGYLFSDEEFDFMMYIEDLP